MIKGVIKNIRPWVLLIGVFPLSTPWERRCIMLATDHFSYGKIVKTLKELTNAILKLAEKSAK